MKASNCHYRFCCALPLRCEFPSRSDDVTVAVG